MNPQIWWYASRASGIIAWLLVSAAVIWGLQVSTRAATRPHPAWVLDLHRYLGALSVAFTAVHLGGLVADNYVHFGARELFVPMASTWQPGAVAWGIVALYVLLAVELTSLVMKRLPRRFWRAVHRTSLGLFVLATVHGFAAGSEAGNAALQWGALATTAVVLFLVVFRFVAPRRAARRVPVTVAPVADVA